MTVSNEKSHSLLSLMPEWMKQGGKFVIVGFINTGVDLGIYFMLTHWVPFFMDKLVLAKAISYPAGVINSFIWNKNWTFKSNTGYFNLQAMIFFVANLIGWGMNSLMMYIGLEIWHLPELICLALAIGIVLIWNFLVSKFIVFRK